MVAPTTVTQLGEPVQAVPITLGDPPTRVFGGISATPVKIVRETVAPINPKATMASARLVSPTRIFASSSGLIRVFGAAAASSAVERNEALPAPQVATSTGTPVVPSVVSPEHIFQPFTQSQIRVVAAATVGSPQIEQQTSGSPTSATTSSENIFASPSTASHVAVAIIPTTATSAFGSSSSASTPLADSISSTPSLASTPTAQENPSATIAVGSAKTLMSETNVVGIAHVTGLPTEASASFPPSPSSSSLMPLVPSTSSPSASRKFTSSAGGIAAVTVGSLVGVAVLAALATYVLCFCRRQCRHSKPELVELGSDAGSPGEEGQKWPSRPLSSASRDGVREMRGLWRQSIDSEASTGYAGPASRSDLAVSPTLDGPVSSSDWTSFVGGHAWTDAGDIDITSDVDRRDHDLTVGTAIRNWNSRFAAGFPTSMLAYPPSAGGTTRVPHPLLVNGRVPTSSPSLYSGTATLVILTQLS